MALELKQSLKLSQQLVMTPQLQQAIKLLQLNRLELAQQCRNELMENPILEESFEFQDEMTKSDDQEQRREKLEDRTTKELDPQSGSGTEDINWENYLNSQSSRPVERGFREHNSEQTSFEANLTRHTSLFDHLQWQLQLTKLSDEETLIGNEIIGNLDESGYFKGSLYDIASRLKVSDHKVHKVLEHIQRFDPVGVGARNLQECLLLQIRHLEQNHLVSRIILHHMLELEKRQYKKIAKSLNASQEEIIEAVKFIQKLDPKPGRQFYDESMQYITPDIYVYMVNDEPVIAQNEDGLPKLRVSNYYQSFLRGEKVNEQTKEYIQDKLRSAIWLIRSIHQRQRTIYKVTESIVKIQREFLDKGVSSLKPMVLKDVAEDIGMHESTVSRVTTNKYVHTPQGIFELKFFFNSSIKRLHGSDMASEAVKEKIRAIVASENQKKPYSDQELVELLRQSNIDIARRTVAKYREMLGIESSTKRKNALV
ncbi:MAG: RNA polymerase factor sigma-54 [Bdellovibrionales bacterium]|nr:RNA polymerase factor sigma-54 [Bdellovibrionales bacterium]